MATTLAIKLTRREILRAVIDAAAAKQRAEVKAALAHGHKLQNDARAANAKMREIAQVYGDTKYKALLKKLKKLLGAEFPEMQAYFTVDMEKESTLSGKFKANGKVSIRLVVTNIEKQIEDLPKDVLEEMSAANDESERLYAAYLVSAKETERLQRKANKYGHNINADYQSLIQTAVHNLGAEATPHLDILIDLVEKSLAVPIGQNGDELTHSSPE